MNQWRWLESTYPYVFTVLVLFIAVSILVVTPICTSGQPILPDAAHADFLVTKQRILQVRLHRGGLVYLETSRVDQSGLARALLSVDPGRKARVAIAADYRLPFAEIRDVLRGARDAGFPSVVLLTERSVDWPIFPMSLGRPAG